MKLAIAILAITLQVVLGCGSCGDHGYYYPQVCGYWGGYYPGYWGGYGCDCGYGGWGYGGHGGYGGWGYGGHGGYGGWGYGHGGYGNWGWGYGGHGGYGGYHGYGSAPAPEEIIIREGPNEIRKVVVEEEFIVPVRKPTRPRPLEVLVNEPTCAPPSCGCPPVYYPHPYNPCY